jgi:hypothetical protein
MKGTLEFNLDDQEDEVAYMRCVKAKNLAIALWDIDQYLRTSIKHAPDSMSKEVYDALQETRDELYRIMSHHSIDLDELLK